VLTGELGRGGMATVYLAQDRKHDRPVALKVLHPDLATAVGAERFLREIRLTAHLQHPHILPLLDSGAAKELLWYVMPYVEGESLRQRLNQDEQLSLDQALEITRQIAAALSYAHGRGVVHRDIKPENILLAGDQAVLSDFGVAQAVSAAGGERVTEAGLAVGTPAYMSPEQASGGQLDARSDIYALACVLYEMLAGHPPFLASTPQEVMARHVTEPPPPLRTIRPDLPTAVEQAITRALAKVPARRFETASEFARALQTPDPATAWAGGSPDASVAVLPFLNLSADPENDVFSDGMTEEIISALTQIKKLHVAARTSSFSFKGKHVDLRVIGERLNVRTVLEGSVRRAGNHLRITVQLVNAADGYHLWSEKYDRELKDIFEVQEEIARSIAERLKVTLEGEQPLVKAGTDSIEAYQLYVEGRTLFFQRGQQLRRSLECFKRAVERDPDYAVAWAGLADAHNMIGFYGLAEPEVSLPQAKAAAERAVALDPSLAEAHSALAMVRLFHGDYAQSELEFLQSLELNPGGVQARIFYGLFYLLWGTGRLEEGISQIKRAIDGDRLSSYARSMLAAAYMSSQNPDAALENANAGLELDPNSFVARWIAVTALWQDGDFAKSTELGEACLATSGRHTWVVATLAVIYADWGRIADAEALYMELEWRAKREYVQPAWLACAALAVDMEAAARYLQEGYARRDPIMIATRRWPLFARLWKQPVFNEIAQRMGGQVQNVG
jgi:serine/threonine protein kinase/Tfp pilus assembly protein PilF